MNIKMIRPLIVLMLMASQLYGQKQINVAVPGGRLKLEAVTDKIVRVTLTPGDKQTPVTPSLITIPYSAKASFSNPAQNTFAIGFITIKIDSKTGWLTFITNGKKVLEEQTRQFKDSSVVGAPVHTLMQSWRYNEKEGIYGLGQFQEGVMNWRNHSVTLVQKNKNVAIPFLVSTNRYGILWDNASLSRFSDGQKGGMKFWSMDGDQLQYYFIAGDTMDDVISGYRTITGTAPLFGKWAYGYWQSKERYKTGTELMEIAKEYRKRKIPIDNLVQDWRYWGDLGWSAMMFDEHYFPHADKMIDSLHRMNFHLMVSVWPALGKETQVLAELKQKGLTFPFQHWTGGSIYNAFDKEARDTYWKYMNNGLFTKGVDAWWMDGVEPEISTADSDPMVVAQTVFDNSGSYRPLWLRNLNAFPLMTTQGVYRNQREESDKKRVFILTRSAFAGQQRNAAATWSGDIAGTWDVFRKQISAGVNFCMAGIPYWNTDIGGFFPSGHGAEFTLGNKDEAYRELYVRWFQFGAFSPIFRAHGTTTSREIWQFGNPGDRIYETLINFDKLRYRLLPYIYANAWKITNQNYTLYRGLPMDFPDDRQARGIDDEFLFGSSFLVCPVTNYMYHQPGSPLDDFPKGALLADDGKSPGLNATYYSGTGFENKQLTKIDPEVHFNFSGAAPEGLTAANYSMRWTGYFKAPYTGKCQIVTKSGDEVRCWFNGQMIIDRWRTRPVNINTAEIDMEEGKLYPIKLEHFHGTESGDEIAFGWKDSRPKEVKATTKIPKTRSVYLPKGAGWTDFWTGKQYPGGQFIAAAAPMEIMPLFIKQGSIIPMGKVMQYSTQSPNDTLEIRIYPGANGTFSLYEDENDNYNYEKGKYTTIKMNWNNGTRTLTIGDLKGSYPGMLKARIFHVVVVNKKHGVGIGESISKTHQLKYNGKALVMKL